MTAVSRLSLEITVLLIALALPTRAGAFDQIAFSVVGMAMGFTVGTSETDAAERRSASALAEEVLTQIEAPPQREEPKPQEPEARP